LKDLEDLRTDGTEFEAALVRLHLPVERDQLAESGAGQELDALEVEQDAFAVVVLHEAEQLQPQLLD